MEEFNHIFDIDPEEWVNVLPEYQKNIITELLNMHDPEEAASSWLEATIDNNSPFGGEKIQNERKFFDIVKKEIQKLLCGSPEYKTERKELESLIKGENKSAIISVLSAAIGVKIGLAAVFLAPAIVVVLMIISKITLKAWCEIRIQ